jgi:peptidoglycan hydrolase-like protein with peptidoglycan-binding domain
VATASISAPALAASQHLGQRTLRQGMSGHDVRVLQDFLTRVGFSTPVVGTFGPQTERNVKRFERRYHLRTNGVVNSQFVTKIRAIVADRDGTAVVADSTGGASFAPSPVTPTSRTPNVVAGARAKLVGGLAVAPASAPPVVQRVIAAANRIATTPYLYGGGHASFNDSAYDCSGSTGYALHGGGLLSSTEDSTEFESYGSSGAGKWITLWANGGHVYMQIAGLWFDTAAQSSSNGNDRWSTSRVDAASGYIERHPSGY